MLPTKLTFVDIETTGSRVTSDRIIEIGMLRVEDGNVVDTYQTLINPETYISPFIEELTGISKHDLEDAPTFEDVKTHILELLDDSIFVAHNVRFDYGFLRNEFKRYDISYTQKHFCTVKLSKYLFPTYRHHNLDALVERFGLTCEQRHRAFADAKAICDFYCMMQKTVDENKFVIAVDKALRNPSIPINLPLKTLDKIPDSAGVYIFYDKNQTPLYVGKSVNLYDRVRSHFTSDHLSGTDMGIVQETAHIETIPTSGELGALFRESQLVKELQPLYNRKLRQSRQIITLKKVITDEGYDTVTILEQNKIEVSEIESIMGIFKSKKQAKELLVRIAKEHRLCEKLLGLNKSKGACFGYHLGWCQGACTKREKPGFYNAKFAIAFMKTRLKPWPFSSPILICEEDHVNKNQEAFLIDKWCYLGSIKGEAFDPGQLTYDYLFNVDIYRILSSFISSHKNKQKIKLLNTSFPQKILSA